MAVWLFSARVLYDDCQSGCQGIEPFEAGISLSDSQLQFILGLMRLAPSELFNEATTTLLMPSSEVWGRLLEQVQGAIPSPLPLGQKVFWWWPQLTGLIAATVIVCSFVCHIHETVRSR